MAMILLQEYFEIRNTMLFIRDSVTNKYFIELAPELSEEEKNLWNQKLSERFPISKLHYEMVLSPEELANYQLPNFSNVAGKAGSIVLHPLYGQDRSLPLGIFYGWLPDHPKNQDKLKIIGLLASMIALSLEAHGLNTDTVYQVSTDQTPMILDGVVGVSGVMKKTAAMVKKVAPSRATVLIRGESGTGKELIARAIHKHSLRHNAPFISINCAALSDNLLESELFGHEQGAFTGAVRSRKGRFELADGGTLFLDEIGDTSLEFQTKLLRVLQEGQFERLGSSKTSCVDVRIICATNVNLEHAISTGTFREDLFYRLNVIALEVPPLRERREDIPLLLQYFLEQLNEEYQKNIQLSQENVETLKYQDWPGNIRELENAIHAAFLMENDGILRIKPQAGKIEQPQHSDKIITLHPQSKSPHLSVKHEEVEAIQKALSRNRGIQLRAAEDLGISLRQLRYRIKKYNIPVRKIQT